MTSELNRAQEYGFQRERLLLLQELTKSEGADIRQEMINCLALGLSHEAIVNAIVIQPTDR